MLLEITALVDARGLPSPLPVLRAKQVLGPLESGAIVEVLATAPSSPEDFARWCAVTGHAIIEHTRDGLVHRLVLRRR